MRRFLSDTLHVARIHPRRSSECSDAYGDAPPDREIWRTRSEIPQPYCGSRMRVLRNRKVNARQEVPFCFYRSIVAYFL